uniref:Hyaluronan/mRNA-binding protein domain-containing protein n=1 Tax=Ditylenchus dipsaci TaxID=166011 RepID=A0A915D048_9BILA
MEYGINTSNKFAFLGGDEDVHDPAEILAQAELAREKAKAAGPKTALKKVVVPVAVEKKVTIAPSANKENVDVRRNQPRKDQPHRGPPGAGGNFERKDRGPRGPPRTNQGNDNSTAPNAGDAMSDRFGENRPPRQPRGQNFERRNNAGGDGQNRGSFGRGGGGAGGGNQGGWQRTGGDHGGPRGGGPRMPRNENSAGGESNTVPLDMDGQPFNRPPNNLARAARGPRNGPRADRISGSDKTGVRSVPKKDGFGKGNWGTEKDELAGETEPNAEGDLNKTVEADGAALENNSNENAEHTDGQEDVEPEQEQIRELTLEEWRAQQKSQKPSFNVRKAGEGGDQKIYQKLVLVKPLTKDEENAEEDDEANQIKREPREKPLNIEVSFSDSQRNRGGYREERGGYRGGEDRGSRGGGNFERGENRRSGGQGGGRGGFGGGRRNNNYNDAGGPGGSGAGRRPQQSGGFNLTAESFPALGAR